MTMKNKKIRNIIIAVVVLAVVLGGGIPVGNMFGLFCEGNKSMYSVNNTQETDSLLKDKTIIFLGSSVTYGYASKGESFADFMEKQDGITAIKAVKSGTTLVDDSKNSYVSRMKKMDANIKADAFVCQLSTNDATKNKPLGEVSESFDINSFDTHTVAGAIEYIIAYASETWNCPVIFYTGTKYDSENYSKMVDLLLDIQSKWGIGVIDLWNNSDMYHLSDEEYDLYMSDSIHPTRAGYRDWWLPVIREYIINFI